MLSGLREAAAALRLLRGGEGEGEEEGGRSKARRKRGEEEGERRC